MSHISRIITDLSPLCNEHEYADSRRTHRTRPPGSFRLARTLQRIGIVVTLCGCLWPIRSFAATPAPNEAAASQTFPLEQLLWREVRTTDDQSVGSVRDVLCQLPSGKILYVAIDPSALYERPRVVAPDTLSVPADRTKPVQIKMTMNDWINAPRLDWSGLEVTQRTSDNESVKGVYQRAWLEPRPGSSSKTPVSQVAAALPTSSGEDFVALSQFHLKRVSVPGWDSEGFLNGFLIDWNSKRVTHVFASIDFPPISPPDKAWYAFPVALLQPPNDQGIFGVNSTKEAVAQAQRVAGNQLRSDVQSIYQFSPTQLPTYMSAAE